MMQNSFFRTKQPNIFEETHSTRKLLKKTTQKRKKQKNEKGEKKLYFTRILGVKGNPNQRTTQTLIRIQPFFNNGK
jgi:hypothetical protein